MLPRAWVPASRPQIGLLGHRPRVGVDSRDKASQGRGVQSARANLRWAWEHHIGRDWAPIDLMVVTFRLCASVSSSVNGDIVKTKPMSF